MAHRKGGSLRVPQSKENQNKFKIILAMCTPPGASNSPIQPLKNLYTRGIYTRHMHTRYRFPPQLLNVYRSRLSVYMISASAPAGTFMTRSESAAYIYSQPNHDHTKITQSLVVHLQRCYPGRKNEATFPDRSALKWLAYARQRRRTDLEGTVRQGV